MDMSTYSRREVGEHGPPSHAARLLSALLASSDPADVARADAQIQAAL